MIDLHGEDVGLALLNGPSLPRSAAKTDRHGSTRSSSFQSRSYASRMTLIIGNS